jgi:hypothetical protein
MVVETGREEEKKGIVPFSWLVFLLVSHLLTLKEVYYLTNRMHRSIDVTQTFVRYQQYCLAPRPPSTCVRCTDPLRCITVLTRP